MKNNFFKNGLLNLIADPCNIILKENFVFQIRIFTRLEKTLQTDKEVSKWVHYFINKFQFHWNSVDVLTLNSVFIHNT